MSTKKGLGKKTAGLESARQALQVKSPDQDYS